MMAVPGQENFCIPDSCGCNFAHDCSELDVWKIRWACYAYRIC